MPDSANLRCSGCPFGISALQLRADFTSAWCFAIRTPFMQESHELLITSVQRDRILYGAGRWHLLHR
jgi:hypothetical protein